MASLVLLSLASLAMAANNSYFSTPEIDYSTASGRPGSSNLNQVTFNVTDVHNGGTANCAHSWPYTEDGPSITTPAQCGDGSAFFWHFEEGNIVDNFTLTIRHNVDHAGPAIGKSPRYVVGSPGASYECGGSGACFFTVAGTEDAPLKIFFE